MEDFGLAYKNSAHHQTQGVSLERTVLHPAAEFRDSEVNALLFTQTSAAQHITETLHGDFSPPLISKLFVFYHKTNVRSGIWSFKMSRSFDASQPSHISSMLLLKNKTYCYCWGKNQFSCPSATVCMLDSMRVAVLIFNKFTDELAKCLCPQSFNLHVWNMLHVQHRSFNWNTCKCVTKAQGKTLNFTEAG